MSLANGKVDSLLPNWDSLDKIHKNLTTQSKELEEKIAKAGEKIEAAKKEKNRKTNYWIPIIGGAVLGIGLAFWLKRKK
jgi:LPXTG-motif cell wall-anchored protein